MTTFMETETAAMPDAFDRVLSDSIQICEVANIYDGQPVEWRGSLDKLARRLTKHTHRDERDGPCFIPVLFNYGRKGGQAEARAMVTLDIELLKALGVIPPPPHAIARQLHNEGLFSTIATSWSHTSELPRYRICLFLSAAIRLDTAEAAALDKWFLIAVVNYLGLQDVCDPMGYRLTQPFYWPACPQASEFYADVIAGEPMGADLVAALMAKAGELKADHDAAEAAEREARARKRPISDRASVIEAFNAAHPISDLFMQYGYTRKGRHYRSPFQTSPSYATRIFPGERSYWVSLSGSDAAEGIGSECKSGGRYGDAFDLFSFFEYSNNFAAAIKAAARELGMKHEKPAGEEWSHAEGVEDFKRGAGEGAETGTEKPKPSLLHIRRVDVFSAEYEPAEYLIDYMLQSGFLYSLTAETGAGKTALMILVSALVATGKPFGEVEVKKGSVIYCVGENADEFRQRMICLRENSYDADEFNGIHVLTPEAHKGLLTERGSAEVATYAGALGGVDLVVVDTAAAFFDGEEENSNTELGEYARRLRRRLCTLPGKPCVVVCSHPTKNARTHDELVPRGGGAFVAEVDGNLTLMKRDVGASEMFWSKKFRGRIDNPVQITLTPVEAQKTVDAKGRPLRSVLAGVTAGPSDIEEANERKLRDRIVVLMADGLGRSVTDIAIGTHEMMAGQAGGGNNAGWKRVSRELKRIAEFGAIEITDGRWKVTPKGLRHAVSITGGRKDARKKSEEDVF